MECQELSQPTLYGDVMHGFIIARPRACQPREPESVSARARGSSDPGFRGPPRQVPALLLKVVGLPLRPRWAGGPLEILENPRGQTPSTYFLIWEPAGGVVTTGVLAAYQEVWGFSFLPIDWRTIPIVHVYPAVG